MTTNKIDTEALNYKLHKWVGIELHYIGGHLNEVGERIEQTEGYYIGTTFLGTTRIIFTEDLNACDIFFSPILKELGYMWRVQHSPLYDNVTGYNIFDKRY